MRGLALWGWGMRSRSMELSGRLISVLEFPPLLVRVTSVLFEPVGGTGILPVTISRRAVSVGGTGILPVTIFRRAVSVAGTGILPVTISRRAVSPLTPIPDSRFPIPDSRFPIILIKIDFHTRQLS
ncbi:MAG: hypothetical protein F6K65_12125 [Moorea sp. SIO3C2]|nr:hypothetical protein [Moorena sp. SIO3C2]